jgi:hypothetical protein
MATDIEKLIRELQSLGPGELRDLRHAVDERMSNLSDPTDPELQEYEFKRRLVAAGLLNEVRPPVPDPGSYRDRNPVSVAGKPLSETIMEERRQVAVYAAAGPRLFLVQNSSRSWNATR